MATAREVLRSKIHESSKQVFQIKAKAADTTPGYINPKSPDWDRYVQLKREISLLLTALVILKYGKDELPPRALIKKCLPHGRQCMLFLERGELKIDGEGNVTQEPDFNPPTLYQHAPRGREKQVILAGWKLLRRLCTKLENNPTKWDDQVARYEKEKAEDMARRA